MTKLKYPKLVLLGDCHIGHAKADIAKLERYVKWIRKNNAHAFLMGDIFEMSTPTHIPKTMWTQIYKPEEQIDIAIGLFNKIKDKIIGGIAGNHEINRVRDVVGINIMEWFLEDMLGVPYCDWGFQKYKIGRQKYNCYFHHGSSSSIRPGYQLDKATKIMENVDLIAIAHNHRLYHAIESKMTPTGFRKIHKICKLICKN